MAEYYGRGSSLPGVGNFFHQCTSTLITPLAIQEDPRYCRLNIGFIGFLAILCFQLCVTSPIESSWFPQSPLFPRSIQPAISVD